MRDIKEICEYIKWRYDPENDHIPNVEVTWAESDLADAVRALLARVEALEKKLLEGR